MNSDKLINENNQLRENLNSENKRYYEDYARWRWRG